MATAVSIRSPTSAAPPSAPSRALAQPRHGRQGRRAGGDRRGAAKRAPTEILAGQRARHAGRRARRRSATRCSTACASTRRGSRRSRARSRQIAALPDPVGEVIEGRRLPNGLDVRKVRVPLGVVAVVYEARPNVTIDAAALCLKSGNAIVLRGSSSAAHSNAVLAQIAAEAAVAAGLPEGCVSLVAGGGREELAELATQTRQRRPDHPARRRGPEGGAAGGRDRAGDLRGLGQLPRLRRRRRRPRPGARRSCSTPRSSARACATPPRRCSSTSEIAPAVPAAHPRARWATRACSCAPTSARSRWPRRRGRRPSSSAPLARARPSEEDWATEYLALTLAVGVVDSAGGGDRAHRPLRQRALRGDRHARHRRGARLPARRRRGVRVRQRLDALHRRRRVRDGRGDRQLDAEAPRARADRAARAVHVQVPRRGRRARPRLSASPRQRAARRSASSAGRSTRRTSGTSRSRATRASELGLERVRADAGAHRRRTSRRARTRAPSTACAMCRLLVARRRGPVGLRARDRARRAVLHRRYLAGHPCTATRTPS